MAVWAALKDLERAVNGLQNQLQLLEVNKQLELKLDRMLRDQEMNARLTKVQEEVREVRALNEVMFNSMVQPDTFIHTYIFFFFDFFVSKHASNIHACMQANNCLKTNPGPGLQPIDLLAAMQIHNRLASDASLLLEMNIGSLPVAAVP